MSISYDVFTNAFLSKVTEYDLVRMQEDNRTDLVDGYMKRAISAFSHICKYDLSHSANDESRSFEIDIADTDFDEIVDIISDGMLVQWLKPYVYKQELLENVLNTRDFVTYSPAELLLRVGNAYSKAQKDYLQSVREYSYNHGDLGDLHL